MSKLIDMSGRKIGKLTVLGYAGSKFRGRASRASWHCSCDCGREIITTGAKLREREGNTAQSCGCAWRLTPERARELAARSNAIGRKRARAAGARKRTG
jgi:hypothetical protein